MPVTGLSFSPDGNQLLSSGYHELLVWDLKERTLARRIGNMGQRVTSIQFASGPGLLVVGCGQPGRGGEVRLVDFASGEVRSVPTRCDDMVLDVALRLLRPGGLFISDNMLWQGRVLEEPPPDADTAGVRTLTARLFASDDFDPSLVPVRDGVSVAVRRATRES